MNSNATHMKRKPNHTELYTLGYEGRVAADVLAILTDEKVRILLDVRYRPQSRKPGMSKSKLTEACSRLGINYVHDRDLGTPPEMMSHVRAGGGYDDKLYDEYLSYLLSKVEALGSAIKHVVTAPTCLLCYEADAAQCHRRVVAEELARRTGLTVKHL